jgi:hypothetical protein
MQPSSVGGIFADSSGTLLSSRQEFAHTNFDRFFLYFFVAMVHLDQWGVQLHLYFNQLYRKAAMLDLDIRGSVCRLE